MAYSMPNGGTYAAAVETSNNKILKYNIVYTYATRDEKKNGLWDSFGILLAFWDEII